jgi:outer membrane protein TolC
MDLSLDDAIQRGLKTNLGVILSGTQTTAARGQRLTELQSLLPSVDFKASETVTQVDLPAQGLRIPGFPKARSGTRICALRWSGLLRT